MSRNPLAALPHELVLRILDSLSTRDWYALAKVNHRLHLLALTRFLSHHSIPNPTSHAHIRITEWLPASRARTAQLDALYGLALLSGLDEVKELTCRLEGPSFDRRHVDFLQRKMARLARFVGGQGLKSLGKVKLVLDYEQLVPSSPKDHDTWYISDVQLRAWVDTFESVMNAIVERGCTALEVVWGSYLIDAYEFRVRNVIVRPLKRFAWRLSITTTSSRDREVLQDSGWEFRRCRNPSTESGIFSSHSSSSSSIRQARLSPTAQTRNALKSFSIHSTLLLLPPCLSWTVSLLASTPSITHLSLGNIFFPPSLYSSPSSPSSPSTSTTSAQHLWSAILPLLATAASSHLTELTIMKTCAGLGTEQILGFFAELPGLRVLDIESGVGFVGGGRKGGVFGGGGGGGGGMEWREMRKISAPLGYVLYFFEPTRHTSISRFFLPSSSPSHLYHSFSSPPPPPLSSSSPNSSSSSPSSSSSSSSPPTSPSSPSFPTSSFPSSSFPPSSPPIFSHPFPFPNLESLHIRDSPPSFQHDTRTHNDEISKFLEAARAKGVIVSVEREG